MFGTLQKDYKGPPGGVNDPAGGSVSAMHRVMMPGNNKRPENSQSPQAFL